MNAYRVLHVEDEPDIREVVKMSLALDDGLTVVSCSSGPDHWPSMVSPFMPAEIP